MTDAEKLKLHKWWKGELKELTRKTMAQEEKRRERAKKRAASVFGDLAIDRREDIDDLYGYGVITARKRDKLLDLWEHGQHGDALYDEKIRLLMDVYEDANAVIRELETKGAN